MRKSKTKLILTACEMSFSGKTDAEVAVDLQTSVSNISRWRKTILWADFEKELIQAHKQSLINAHVAEPVTDERHPTQ